ncbi:MAG: DnaJ domain-containing protein [Lachnospiraceae bacterium]|nr:DnaJ domain-containing protein [Lachnospiraceae bacterium]
MILSRQMACQILGLPEWANEADIKTAYKNLAKVYHPDAGIMKDSSRYILLQEAYHYLLSHPYMPAPKPRVFGGKAMQNRQAEYHAFNKKMKEQKRARQEAFEEQERRRDEEYRKAMAAINDIIVAETLKKLIRDQL